MDDKNRGIEQIVENLESSIPLGPIVGIEFLGYEFD
jgi:hypothetical protein